MSRLKRLIQEIHRRSLWQVLGIYLGGAWVAFQETTGELRMRINARPISALIRELHTR